MQRRGIREQQRRWDAWVRKPIFADAGVYNIRPRHVVIRNFVANGLIPFVKAKGYVFAKDITGITNSLLRYLFALSEGKKVIFKNPYKEYIRDHRIEFDHRFDSLEIEEFWERWNDIEDFQDGRFGNCLQYTLPFFLWVSIDLERSPTFVLIEKALDEIEELEEAQYGKKELKGKDDPYLHDTSRINYEDRHWH